jgi:uncharacterized protein YceK
MRLNGTIAAVALGAVLSGCASVVVPNDPGGVRKTTCEAQARTAVRSRKPETPRQHLVAALVGRKEHVRAARDRGAEKLNRPLR